MRAFSVILSLIAALALSAAAAAAEEVPVNCSTPKKAAITWLANLPPNGDRPDRAIACFDWAGAKVPAAERARLAGQLKRALDVQAMEVPVDSLPDAPDAGGAERVFLFSDADTLPEIWMVRSRDRWVISAASIESIPDVFSKAFPFDIDALVGRLPASMRRGTFLGMAWWQVLAMIVAIALGLAARALVTRLVATQGKRLVSLKGDTEHQRLIVRAARPIGTVAMAGVLWYLLPLLALSIRSASIALIGIRVLAALGAVVSVYRVIDVVSNVFAARARETETKLDDQLIPLIRKTVKVFVAALGAIFVLQNMNVDVASLLAGASLGGLAFTLAAKDTVANLFGSVSIFADRPFQIGDWVVIEGTEGIVEEVGMRSTRIRTFYNSLVALPNSKVANAVVDNYGARTYRRTFVTVGVTYDTSPEQIQAFCDGIRAILQANKFVRKDYYEVHFKGFGDFALEIMLYFFFKVDSWSEELKQRHNVFLEVVRLAEALGISFAFPTQTVHVDSMATPREVPQRTRPEDEALGATVLAFGPEGGRARPAGPRISHGFFAGAKPAGAKPAGAKPAGAKPPSS